MAKPGGRKPSIWQSLLAPVPRQHGTPIAVSRSIARSAEEAEPLAEMYRMRKIGSRRVKPVPSPHHPQRYGSADENAAPCVPLISGVAALLDVNCPACGTSNSRVAPFCTNCGCALPMPGQSEPQPAGIEPDPVSRQELQDEINELRAILRDASGRLLQLQRNVNRLEPQTENAEPQRGSRPLQLLPKHNRNRPAQALNKRRLFQPRVQSKRRPWLRRYFKRPHPQRPAPTTR